MKRWPSVRRWTLCMSVVAIGALSLGYQRRIQAEKPSTARAAASDQQDDALVVHEWGTFTTYSGSDGVFLDFRPLAAEHQDLPSFVRDRTFGTLRGLISKARLRGKVRMETPVTYFYTNRVREVDVRVDFVNGLLTEFYPPVHGMSPPLDENAAFGAGEPLGHSQLAWNRVTLIPTNALAPHVANAAVRDWLQHHLASSAVPHEDNDQHYAQARATDSALVHVRAPAQPNSSPDETSAVDHLEKFLFYRGVGRFDMPLQALLDDQGGVTVHNQSSETFRSLVLTQVSAGQIRFAVVDAVPGESSLEFPPTRPIEAASLAELVQARLTATGLYAKEAAAMVATWQDSWFHEDGTRIFYLVPESITNRILPLSITPTPDETVRVLVGRMELMTAESERHILAAIAESRELRREHEREQERRAEAESAYVAEPYPIPTWVGTWGRMAEPALVRVTKIASSAEVRAEAEQLLAQLRTR